MATLRPPSTSPSPSPTPPGGENRHRASMGPAARVSAAAAATTSSSIPPPSPRPAGTASSVRPTSELLGSAGMFQTPEGIIISCWLVFCSLTTGSSPFSRSHRPMVQKPSKLRSDSGTFPIADLDMRAITLT
jgi:hypothetical protein